MTNIFKRIYCKYQVIYYVPDFNMFLFVSKLNRRLSDYIISIIHIRYVIISLV